MNEIKEIKIPKGVESISVKQHEDKIVIEFIPKGNEFKNGDFVYEDGRIMIVKRYPNMYHANCYPKYSNLVGYNGWYGVDFSLSTFRYATKEEKQLLIDAMKKDGKRWNAEIKCIEDIPQPKFKSGDKVKIKDGISSKTHRCISPYFTSTMDEFIGKELTVKEYTYDGFVVFDDYGYQFAEEWLEPCNDEPKKGDFAIFWDYDDKEYSAIHMYDRKGNSGYYDSSGIPWDNAVKFESKEQFEKILRGEI